MDLKEFKERYFRCLEKADLKTSWWLSDDCDEDAEVFIDESGDIYIKEIKTPYNYKDVVKVKYRQYFEDDFSEQDYYVAIWFCNGDYLRLGMNDYRDYIDLILKDGKCYFKDKVFEYWKNLQEVL